MAEAQRPQGQHHRSFATSERDHRTNPGALAASLARPMAERLELALSWNAAAAELRAALAPLLAKSKPSSASNP